MCIIHVSLNGSNAKERAQMKAAIVLEAGKAPVYGDFKEPVPGQDEVRINVAAAALSNVVRSRASGTHYSSSGELPFVVGIDGVGRLDDGRRVYFVLPKPPLGSMSERTVVRSGQWVALPDGLDDVTAAAIANPGMSAWAALKERAKLAAGETVLVNGATGTAGRLAVQIAKYMGAKKGIATGRNIEVLKSLAGLAADVTIPLVEDGRAGRSLSEAICGPCRCCCRLPLGPERRTVDHRGGQSRQRRGADPLRPCRFRQCA